MRQYSILQRVRDRDILRNVSTIQIYMVYKDGKVKFYENAGVAFHAAQQTGGLAISGSIPRDYLYLITEKSMKR